MSVGINGLRVRFLKDGNHRKHRHRVDVVDMAGNVNVTLDIPISDSISGQWVWVMEWVWVMLLKVVLACVSGSVKLRNPVYVVALVCRRYLCAECVCTYNTRRQA